MVKKKIEDIIEILIRKKTRSVLGRIYKLGKNDQKLDESIYRFLYPGMKLLTEKDVNDEMYEKLVKNIPFSFCRVGMTEANIIGEYIEKTLGIREKYDDEWIKWLYRTSGFFGKSEMLEEDVDRYAKLSLDLLPVVDYFAVWQPHYIDFLAKHYAKGASLFKYNKITGHAVNSNYINHWSKGLKGKRVIVITSFPQSIEKQYARKELLCKNPECSLPEFELITFKAPETEGGYNTEEFLDWFNCYELLVRKVLEIEFDVAIVGCGAYGLPLSCEIRKKGKTVIELCGSVTKLFGIYNNVMERRYPKELEEWRTKEWIRPIETPMENYKSIERAAYW